MWLIAQLLNNPKDNPIHRESSGMDLSFLPYLEDMYLNQTEILEFQEDKRLFSERELREMEEDLEPLRPEGSRAQASAGIPSIRVVGSEGEMRPMYDPKDRKGKLGKAKKKFSSCKMN